MRRWVRGVLAQADKDIAATTLAVLWNAERARWGTGGGSPLRQRAAGVLLREPFAALGSTTPELDASLAAHATLGMLSDCLWRQVQTDARRGGACDLVLSALGEGLSSVLRRIPRAPSSAPASP